MTEKHTKLASMKRVHVSDSLNILNHIFFSQKSGFGFHKKYLPPNIKFCFEIIQTRLPSITLMGNRGHEKVSMRGTSGFAEVELNLSTTLQAVKICLIYFLLKAFI